MRTEQEIDRSEDTQAQLLQSAKLAAVGEMVACVVHELSNPLTSILGFAEVLLKEMESAHPCRQDMETIVREARRAREIVGNLLGFVRQAQPAREGVNLNQLLQQTVDLLRYQLAQEGVDVEQGYDLDIAPLPLDAGQVQQVLLNLINNAVQAMPQGGRLHLRTAQDDGSVSISVEDTGVGIPAEHLERIFEPFFTTKPDGTGLGLAISQVIVQGHGGQIVVQSRLGQGSTFTVRLPREPRGGKAASSTGHCRGNRRLEDVSTFSDRVATWASVLAGISTHLL